MSSMMNCTDREGQKEEMKINNFSDTTLKGNVRGHKHMALAEHKLSTPLSKIYWVGVVVCYVLGFQGIRSGCFETVFI